VSSQASLLRARALGPGARFAIRFAGAFLVLELLYHFALRGAPAFLAYLEASAAAGAWLLRLGGVDAVAESNVVHSVSHHMSISSGCDALEPMLLLLAGVFAHPAGWSGRAVGALAGCAALVGLNLVRIVTLFHAGERWPDAFEILHLGVWQTVFVVATLLLWLAWTRWARDRASRGG